MDTPAGPASAAAPLPDELRVLAPVPSLLALTLRAVRHRGQRGAALPAWGLRGQVSVDDAHLARYRRVCAAAAVAAADAHALPPLYPQVLAYPLQLALVTDPAFPFAAMGLVHLENRIRLLQTRPTRGPLDVRVWSTALAPHDKGSTFDIELRVADDHGPLWEGRARALSRHAPGRSTSVAARPIAASSAAAPATSPATSPAASAPAMTPVASWAAPADIGRRYARASGDWNPIHLSPLTARLFGFPRAIAHGLWHKARALAALAAHLPAAAVEIDVRFQRPVLLPAELHLLASAPGATGRFALQGADGTPHLAGRWAPL
jgi:acyl dehydratase